MRLPYPSQSRFRALRVRGMTSMSRPMYILMLLVRRDESSGGPAGRRLRRAGGGGGREQEQDTGRGAAAISGNESSVGI